MTTKLTVTLPDTIHQHTKALAKSRGETVSEIIRAALEQYIAEALEETEDVRAVQEVETRIAAGEEQVRDWSDIEKL